MPEQVCQYMLGQVLTFLPGQVFSQAMTEDSEDKELTPERAKQLSAMGASKGGRARASVLTKEQRSAIAREAVRARWIKAGRLKDFVDDQKGSGDVEPAKSLAAPELPFSMFPGKLKIGDLQLECHVLNDERRVFTQGEMVRALTGGTDSSNLARYLRAKALERLDLSGGPIRFRIPGNPQLAVGSEATLLIEICEAYLDARAQGDVLRPHQKKLARQAEIIVRACAKTGIIALIDEATGYQKVRAKNALQVKLQAFIADELQDWALMFPQEFWIELARLEGVHYSARSRPLRWGKYIMLFVYDAIDGDVGKELRKKNPNPRFLRNHHQWLKKFGRDKVHDHLERVITIMKLCNNMDDFREKFARVFKKSPAQLSLFDFDIMATQAKEAAN